MIGDLTAYRLQWHRNKMEKTMGLQEYSFVWLKTPFFWDEEKNKPKKFRTFYAHFYATLYICLGVGDYVYVQPVSESIVKY